MNPNDTTKTTPKMRTFATDLSASRLVSKDDQTIKQTPAIPAPPLTADTGAIPPFHTFNNSHKVLATATTIPKILENKTPTVTSSQAQQIITQSSTKSQTTTESLPAVIITDTKRKRFSLTEALGDSMTQWWQTKREEAQKRKVPKYTVASPERRKGVIQKATVKTGRESTADHEAVISRIKAAKQIPHTPVIPVVNQILSTPSTPTWETSTQKESYEAKPTGGLVTQKIQRAQENVVTFGTSLSETKPIILNHIITAVPSTTVISNVIPVEVLTTTAALAPEVLITKPIATVDFDTKKAVVLTPIPTVVVETTESQLIIVSPLITPLRPKIIPAVPKPQPVIPLNILVPTISKAIEVSAPPVSTYPSVFQSEYIDTPPIRTEAVTERRFAPPREVKRSFIDVVTQTNQLVFISFGILLFVIVTGLGMRSYLQNSTSVPEASIITTEMDTTFDTSSVAPAPFLVYTPEDLFTELKNQRSATDDLFEITFISALTNTVVSPSEFFSFVDAPIVFDFKETVSAVTFGGYMGAPWITISLLDKTTALGGMLQWESTMASNLAPIFGNISIMSQNKFGDGITGGSDVRILKNSNGEEELVWGFINDTTIIITNNTTSFVNLATNFPTR